MKILMNQVMSFQDLYSKIKSQSIPIKTAYKLNKLFSALEKEREFYTNKFKEILEKYAEREENGDFTMSVDKTSIIIKPDLVQDCNKEIFELENLEIELPNISLTLEELEAFELSLQDMAVLDPLIAE